ncbi:MAG: molybdopterin-binding protein [Paracoccaceae bacterium]|nr:molybdopterin-binding protein [Paracoccaceae bacterium]
MKFGVIPVTAAGGSILAHSVGLSGRRLRKGLVLSESDVAALVAEGVSQITVAQLTEVDCSENKAAHQLAAALVPDMLCSGMRLSEAFTGRVNIFATGPGVIRLETGRLLKLNQIDPMITLATVPDYTQMSVGGMIATVKIISYGVPVSALERACLCAKGALRIAMPVHKTATLIITDITGGPGAKGSEAIKARLQALGIQLKLVQMVPHQIVPLTDAIAKTDTDMVLILTGSATSDVEDVAPQALRAAKGKLIRFGMPVDPGNLLFFGKIRGKDVIGLPGCARSSALNGADLVLSRLACGLAITGKDIAAMGVGGLLKEIPSRPMPRIRRP